MHIAIIGAGAAGCFCAILAKRNMPEAVVEVFEGGTKPLAKVAITGGGRCNLTNSFRLIGKLSQAYPRGEQLMKRALRRFSHLDAMAWWEQEGVRLVTQEDECVFPQSQDAMQIVHTLTRLMERYGVELRLRHRVTRIEHLDAQYRIALADAGITPILADKVIVTAGGKPSARGFEMLAPLGLKIEAPVPSLFTFNIEGRWHTTLMGCVVENAQVTLAGTKLKASGPLLLTHWGMSGPAILRLSSYAARTLAENDYKGTLVVNWMGGMTDEAARDTLRQLAADNGRKLVTTTPPAGLTTRFWQSLLVRYGIVTEAAIAGEESTIPRWAELGKKQFSRIVTALIADEHRITGRCAFKEEFVTCGGVSLSEINPNTMESRKHSGLYFAGEILDVDAVTGGFNLQAAWSMAYVAAQHILEMKK